MDDELQNQIDAIVGQAWADAKVRAARTGELPAMWPGQVLDGDDFWLGVVERASVDEMVVESKDVLENRHCIHCEPYPPRLLPVLAALLFSAAVMLTLALSVIGAYRLITGR